MNLGTLLAVAWGSAPQSWEDNGMIQQAFIMNQAIAVGYGHTFRS